ncbi:uncharacterized protein LOC129729238 [Wyeomyia smithii]|uniref:uncharacterized protein LOC129729238 n=1 Tax=Wyeomyia smithii TaxID=174621 RepID=UPI00246815BC|nr:uncharacterized protein LOC129729238 [Wyeomyia smithii]XP_055543714.1 uncharacterized protein LOC129729238 [Wyeomyia smithii]XP_055543715.1 uncharacterized protein LOC129729238 [Wyeomyia smithii]XP_055543716.1 uncharacterized protein LOC129729238 [Wyeomyia smithii]
MLVTMAGPSLYSIASRICSPDDPCTKPYKDLIELLKEHFAPSVNVLAERYKFRKVEQSSSQTISEFIIQLKAQSHSCDFKTFLPEALRDQFVAGVQNSNLRTKLLGEADLTFEKACTIARNSEAAEQESRAMQGSSKLAALHRKSRKSSKPQENQFKSVARDNKANDSSKSFRKSVDQAKQCFRCGRNHKPETCPAKQWTCFACGKAGHVSTMYRSSKEKSSGNQGRVAEMSEAVESWRLNLLSPKHDGALEHSVGAGSTEAALASVGEISPSKIGQIDVPATMQLVIEGVPVTFEIDTGACDSVISSVEYHEKLSHVKLNPTHKSFQSVSGQSIRPQGELVVKVTTKGGGKVSLSLFVIQPEKDRRRLSSLLCSVDPV